MGQLWMILGKILSHLALSGPHDSSKIGKRDAQLGIKRSITNALHGNGKNGQKDLDTLFNSVQLTKT